MFAPEQLRRARCATSSHRRRHTREAADKVRKLQTEIDERRRAQERVQHLNRVYAVLSGINSLIVRVANREANREALCQEARRLAVQEGRFQVAWIALKDPQTRQLVPVAWAGPDPELQQFTQVSALGNPERDDIVSRMPRCGFSRRWRATSRSRSTASRNRSTSTTSPTATR